MGEWDDHYNSTTFHVAIVFGKPLGSSGSSLGGVCTSDMCFGDDDGVGGDNEHSKEEEQEGVKEVVDDEETVTVPYRPRLICFTNGDDGSGGGGAGRQQQQQQHSYNIHNKLNNAEEERQVVG